jgi:hypothetical protein
MIRTKRAQPAALTIFAIIFCTSCSTHEPEQIEYPTPSREWVTRQIRVSTLDRMIQEDPERVLDNSDEFSINQLTEAEILTQEEGSYSIQTDVSEWNTSEQPSENTHINEIDFTITVILENNNVTWCNTSPPGDKFVQEYIDLHRESVGSHEEYRASIADYVNCGTGEL